MKALARRKLEQVRFGIKQKYGDGVDMHQFGDPIEQHGEQQVQIQP